MHEISTAHKTDIVIKKVNKLLLLSNSQTYLAYYIKNVKMSTVDGNLTFISMINFLLH